MKPSQDKTDNHKVEVSFTEAEKVHSKCNSDVAEARDEQFSHLKAALIQSE